MRADIADRAEPARCRSIAWPHGCRRCGACSMSPAPPAVCRWRRSTPRRCGRCCGRSSPVPLLLDELTTGLDLDAFVCFSSIASLWGGKEQAHYAAANHVLDAFAHDRRARGLPALTVNWGPWSGDGMAVGADRELLKRMGISALTSRQNLAALAALLGAETGPRRRSSRSTGRSSRTAALPGGAARVCWRTSAPPAAGRPGFAGRTTRPSPARQLLADGGGQKRRLLVTHLQQEIARILGFPPGRLPDPNEGFFQLGMDLADGPGAQEPACRGAWPGPARVGCVRFSRPPTAWPGFCSRAWKRPSPQWPPRSQRTVHRLRGADRDRRHGVPLSRRSGRSGPVLAGAA